MSFFRLLGIHGHPAGVGGAGDEALVRVLPVHLGAPIVSVLAFVQ